MAEQAQLSATAGQWSLRGELDFSTVPGILARSGTYWQGSGAIEIDLQGVTRSDSAGLALLVEWLRTGARTGRAVHFANVPQQLQSIARVCGLTEILSLPK